MTRTAIFCVLLFAAAIANTAEAACKKGQALIKQKTALRRGPGLNYPPNAMVEEGKCWKVLERSADDQWVMIEQKDTIGWVPASMLADDDRQEVLKDDKKKGTGPIGSGQERGFVVTRGAAALLIGPQVSSEAHRMLPAGSKLLALSMTVSGDFVEVRDERGQTGWVAARGLTDDGAVLPSLPRLDEGLSGTGKTASSGKTANNAAGPGERRETKSDGPPEMRKNDGSGRVIPRDEQTDLRADTSPANGVPADITIELAALVALPSHALDSNGNAGYRRYTMNAFATGAHFEAKANALTPMRLKLAYDFTLLTGLEQAGAPNKAVSGQQHEARLLLGYPIDADFVRFVPELGYAFHLFTMDPALPGSTDIQFVSNHTHSASLGANAIFAVTEDLSFELEAAGLLGTSIEFPIDLGGASLSLGARAGAGVGYQLGGGAGLVARYQFVLRSAPFSGASTTDPSITEAKIKHTENSFGLGLSFAL